MISKEILSKKQKELLNEERLLLHELLACLQGFKRLEIYARELQQIAISLDEIFMLVVMGGEFNTGKSSLINALLGGKVVEEDVIASTDKNIIIHYGAHSEYQSLDANTMQKFYPADFLRHNAIVDTPGGNALEEHEQIRDEFIPRSDLILFVMLSIQACTRNEKKFLARIRQEKSEVEIVIILNQIDRVRTETDLDKIIDTVQKCCDDIGLKAEIFPVSASYVQNASEARQQGREEDYQSFWEKSRFSALNRFLTRKLQETERVRTKLLRPLNHIHTLLAQSLIVIDDYEYAIEMDVVTISNLRILFEKHDEQIRRDLKNWLSRIQNILSNMQRRGEQFLDETIRLNRLPEMLRTEGFQKEYEKKIIGQSVVQMEDAIRQFATWFVEERSEFWMKVGELKERSRAVGLRQEIEILDTIDEQSLKEKDLLFQLLSQNVTDVVRGYDLNEEAHKLAQGLRQVVMRVASGSAVSVVGPIGSLAAAIASVVGAPIAATIAGLLAISGLSFLAYAAPQERSKLKAHLDQHIQELETELSKSITEFISKEADKTRILLLHRVINPYTDFVDSKRGKLSNMRKQFISFNDRIAALRPAIDNLR